MVNSLLLPRLGLLDGKQHCKFSDLIINLEPFSFCSAWDDSARLIMTPGQNNPRLCLLTACWPWWERKHPHVVVSTLRSMEKSHYKVPLDWLTYLSRLTRSRRMEKKSRWGTRVLRALDCCGHSHPVCFSLALQGLDSHCPSGVVPLSSILVPLCD